jgi:hypothetical protein
MTVHYQPDGPVTQFVAHDLSRLRKRKKQPALLDPGGGHPGLDSLLHSPSISNAFRSSCYWAPVNSSADRTCVFTIADFSINFARAGTQTHMDLGELPSCRDWEPMATMTNRATENRAKRLMG